MNAWPLHALVCLPRLLAVGAGGVALAAAVGNPDGVAVIIGNRDYSRTGGAS